MINKEGKSLVFCVSLYKSNKYARTIYVYSKYYNNIYLNN